MAGETSNHGIIAKDMISIQIFTVIWRDEEWISAYAEKKLRFGFWTLVFGRIMIDGRARIADLKNDRYKKYDSAIDLCIIKKEKVFFGVLSIWLLISLIIKK